MFLLKAGGTVARGDRSSDRVLRADGGDLMVRAGKFQQGLPDDWSPRPGRLTIGDCEQILLGLGRGISLTAIARSLDRSTSTISREVANSGGRDEDGAWRAHQRARERARCPKPWKLRRGRLLTEVSRRLLSLWSPQEISERLRLDHPDDLEMRVSHETIYQSLYVQGRGELRREAGGAACAPDAPSGAHAGPSTDVGGFPAW